MQLPVPAVPCKGPLLAPPADPSRAAPFFSLIVVCFWQGVGATPGCVRRRGRLAEMHLEQGNAAEAERLLRAILAYVESTQARALRCAAGCPSRAAPPHSRSPPGSEPHGRRAAADGTTGWGAATH